jgi:hydrogenase maturation protease
VSRPRVLIAGVGNVFLGDDGFGVAVVERLRRRPQPDGVAIVDFGIRGIDLAYALQDCDAAVVLDAVRRGGAPGTLYVLEPDVPAAEATFEMHHLTPDLVLGWSGCSLKPITIRLVGCEPATFGPEGVGRVGLSPAASAAADQAVHLVEALVRELLDREVPRA